MFKAKDVWNRHASFSKEESGTDICETCTQTALDQFIEALDASMAPLLNLPGLSMLYLPEAVVETELPEPDGSSSRCLLRGRAEIEGYFERLSERLASTQHVERDRSIRGRRALWSGIVRAIRVSNGAPITLNASYRLEFDEAGLVMHQSTRLAPSRAR